MKYQPNQQEIKRKAVGFGSRVYTTIKEHFLLRNLVMAFSVIVVAVYIVSVILNLYTRHGQKYRVPDFKGITIENAGEMARDAGKLELLVIDSIYYPKYPPGMIIDQSPKAGAGVKSGRKVFLTINAVSPRKDVVPYVTGFSLRQAKNMLESKGFEIDRLVYQNDIATNNVLSQSVNGKTIYQGDKVLVPLSSRVKLVVGRSGGTQLPVTPKVIGLSLREGKSKLWEVGLNIGKINQDEGVNLTNIDAAKIYKQTPNQLSRADFGSQVNLWITLDNDKLNTGEKSSENALHNTPEVEIEDVSDEDFLKDIGF